MCGYSDLLAYESEAERNAVCAELARMLRIVPLNSSPTTSRDVSPSLPLHGAGVVGNSSLEHAA